MPAGPITINIRFKIVRPFRPCKIPVRLLLKLNPQLIFKP